MRVMLERKENPEMCYMDPGRGRKLSIKPKVVRLCQLVLNKKKGVYLSTSMLDTVRSSLDSAIPAGSHMLSFPLPPL